MKDRRKIRRVSLKVSEPFLPQIIGIVSADNDYRVSQSVNKILGLHLSLDASLTIKKRASEDIHFSRFSDSGGNDSGITSLVSNKSGNEYLLPSISNIDYLFLLPEDTLLTTMRDKAARIKDAEMITAVFIIDVTTLKDKNRNLIIQ